jgi:nitroreductase
MLSEGGKEMSAKKKLLIAGILLCFVSAGFAAEMKPVKLPPPDTQGGKPLMQCLKERKTERVFSTKKLPSEMLSGLLWAACGINRPESGNRTAPTARNWQEIDVYVALEEGLYIYNAKTHSLDPAVKSDLRKKTAHLLQPSRASIVDAPLQLIYVADYSKMGITASQEDKNFYSSADAAFIAQNVYLYCASAGLATGVRAFVDREALGKDMKLREKQKIILVQAVGYPPDK